MRRRSVPILISIVIALVFFVAAVAKAIWPQAAVALFQSVLGVPLYLAIGMWAALVMLECFFAAWLASGIWARYARLATTILLTLMMVVGVWLSRQGHQCTCFGPLIAYEGIAWMASRNAFLALLCCTAEVLASREPVVDSTMSILKGARSCGI